MENMNVHRWVQVAADNLPVQAGRLVTRVDGFRLPIRPVERRLKECQRKRMRKRIRYYFPSVAAVQVAAVYVCDLTIGPVESALKGVGRRCPRIVKRQTVRPEDVRIDDHPTTGDVTVHTGALNLWNLAPVRPEHQPVARQRSQTLHELKETFNESLRH